MTICAAILISGVVSVTLTPMLCSRFLRAPEHHQHSWFYRVTERFFEGMLHAYDSTLKVVLRLRLTTMAAGLAVLAGTVYMFINIPKGFIPDQDTDQLSVITEAAQGTSFYEMAEYQKVVADIVRQNPNVEALMSTVGGTGASTLGGPNYGEMVVRLKPRDQRKELVNQIIDDLRPKVANIPGMKVYLQNPPTIQIGGQVTKSLYQISLVSTNKPELYATSEKLMKAIGDVPGIHDLTTDLAITSPQVRVSIDRDKAASLQVNANNVEGAFYDAFGPKWVSTIYAAINEYKVLLELEPEFQADPHSLSLLYFKSTTGQLIPLETLATITQEAGPQSINHFGMLPAVTVSYNIKPGYALGDVVKQVQAIADETVPHHVTFSFQGAAKEFESSLANLAVLLMVAILVVYIVLGILYESYIHPLTILSGLALGRLRRADHAVPVPHGSEYLCVRGTDHADRHRGEERHHADRLRARRRTQPGLASAEGDL